MHSTSRIGTKSESERFSRTKFSKYDNRPAEQYDLPV